jgi:2'-acyl-2-O-sulfo-trehalose (hydroxy)phthioceranyltransferase
LLIGPVEVATIEEWEPGPGSLITWQPTPASRDKAREAPISSAPPSYIQARHLRNFAEQTARGIDHSRLLISACDVRGRCDVRAMTYVINGHLRRHETYRSWFEYQDADHIVRHTITNPEDIEFVPTKHGEMTSAELREQILATPNSLQWDCFEFGIIQTADHFTFFASIDHLHVDGQFLAVGLMEFQMMYAALVSGAPPVQLPPAGSYLDYCVRQRESASELSLDSPQIGAWIEFAENNDGAFPKFPLPLGDPSVPCSGGLLATTLMDEQQTERFETACVASGARFIGGLFAAVALAVYELTGAEAYYGLSPMDTRTPADLATQGWFTGLVPVTVPIAAGSFGEIARAAQDSFNAGTELAHVPFERVVELAPWLTNPQPLFPMLNFFDAGAGPLAPLLTNVLDDVHIAGYSDCRITYPMSTVVGRFRETALTVLFPDNPVARDSVDRYVEALKSVCARVAEGRSLEPLRVLTEHPRQTA